MQKLISSKHLEGVSDLTLSAPIKQGFIDAFETVTYEGRLRTIMEALFSVRATSREHSMIKPFVDTADRIQALLDFRLAIHGDELLLSATFDRPFEPYMRLIWDPLGPLLDVIFCNCEGYVTATEHSFEDYLAWVRRSQIDTNFFYAASGHSVSDIQYATQIEKLQREADKRYRPSSVIAPDPIKDAARIRNSPNDELRKESCQLGMEALVALYKLTDFYPADRPDGKYLLWATQQLLEGWPIADGVNQLQEFGWQGLVADQLVWLSGEGAPKKRTPRDRLTLDEENIQGGILRNYSKGEAQVQHGALLLMRITDAVRARAFIKQLTRDPPPKPEEESKAAARKGRGLKAAPAEAVVEATPPTAKVGEATPPTAKQILDRLRVQRYVGEKEEKENKEALEGDTFLNVAFSRHGLLKIGLSAADYDRLPQEFREGMEDRAGLLGDVRDNHPRRWKLPPRYRADAPGAAAETPGDATAADDDETPVETPVEMTEVDLVCILRTVDDRGDPPPPPGQGTGTLDAIVRALGSTTDRGLKLLAVEPMRRAPQRDNIPGTDHFGFRDGISKLTVTGTPSKQDDIPTGDVFLGYANSRTDGPPAEHPIFDDGSFLVLRKLSQDVGRLRDFVRRETDNLNAEVRKEAYRDRQADRGTEPAVFIREADLYAKMMGRDRDGRVILSPPREGNDFDYKSDPRGTRCPFQSHIRRANPRTDKSETNGRPTPRLLRRGHSYGPGYDGDEAQKKADRGIFFMAYNSSIAEQYEVIQRWINGGNSTKVASWQSDPLMGVGQYGDPRTFRFIHKGRTCRVKIPDPFVKLCWGAYLFVPSMSALRAIGKMAPDVRTVGQAEDLEQAQRGETIVKRLLALAAGGAEGRIAAGAAWKRHLEDFAAKDPGEKDEANAIWAAIRLHHGGAIKVPYGVVPPRETPRDAVLVASKDLVMRVFGDPYGHYSMSGQMARMRQSFGEIFLGMDKGPVYEEKSRINTALLEITEEQAFELARASALNALAVSYRVKEAVDTPKCKIDLRRHFITASLAAVCHAWFGIPDAPPPASRDGKNFVDPWGWSWDPAETRKPRCPGDFMAASRYCFYPDPITRVRAFGKSHGQALRKAIRSYFDTLRVSGQKNGTGLLAPFSDEAPTLPRGFLTTTMAALFEDNDELASNVIGVMTGFLPPADGCMRSALYEWIEDKTLSRVQHDLTSCKSDAGTEAERTFDRANKALRPWLERAMQKRPAPDLVWRTATCDHRLANVEVAADDRIFVGIVSALAEDAAAGITDVCPIFGGKRDPKRADSPLHACPGYKAAMGTMLGILSALLDSFKIEPLPATMLVALSEPSGAIRKLCRSKEIRTIAAGIVDAAAVPVVPAKQAKPDSTDAWAGHGRPRAERLNEGDEEADGGREEHAERGAGQDWPDDVAVDAPAK